MGSVTPLLAIPMSLVIVLIATGLGMKVLGLIGIKTRDSVEEGVFGAGLGLGALAYLVLAVGLLGILHWWVILGILVLMALLSARQTLALVRSIGRSLRVESETRLSAAGTLISGGVAILGGLAIISALAPPSVTDWDGLAYHLAVPKMYLRHHRIFYVPFISHSNFPFLIEMLYTIGLSFGSTAVAKLFHYAMYVIGAVGVFSIGRRHISPPAGTIGALIFMSVPLNVWEAGIAYADLSTAVYILLAAYSILNWEDNPSRGWLVLAGVMGGFALGTKVLALVPILALCLWVLIARGRQGSIGRGFGAACLLGGTALLTGAPWYIKTCAYTGNPVYPFLYNIFGGRYWSIEAAESYRAAQLEFGMGRGILQFIMLPWNVAMNGAEFYDKGAVVLFGLIGPAFLGFLGIQALLGRSPQDDPGRLRRPSAKLLLVSGAFLISWFFLMQSARYLVSIIPLLSVAAGASAARANTEWRIGRHFANVFLVFCVLVGILVGFLAALDSGRAAVGLEPADEYLSRTLSIYAAEKSVNENTPEDARIVLYDEVRGFYLDREYIWGNPGHHEMIPYRRFETGGQLIDWLMEHGYTHALVNWQIAGDSAEGHRRLLHEAIGTGRMVELDCVNNVSVYEFTER